MYMKEIFPFDVKLLKRDEDKFGRTPCKTIKIKGTIKISRPLRLVIPFQREFHQRYHTISLDYKIQFTNIYILWIIKYYDKRLHNQRFMLLKRFKMTYHFNHVRSSSPNYRKTE